MIAWNSLANCQNPTFPTGTGQQNLPNVATPLYFNASILNTMQTLVSNGANPNLTTYKYMKIMAIHYDLMTFHISTTSASQIVKARYYVDKYNAVGVRSTDNTFGNFSLARLNQLSVNNVRDTPINGEYTKRFRYTYRVKHLPNRQYLCAALLTEFSSRPGTAIANIINFHESAAQAQFNSSSNFNNFDGLFKNFHVLVAPDVVPGTVDNSGKADNIGIYQLNGKVEVDIIFSANQSLTPLVDVQPLRLTIPVDMPDLKKLKEMQNEALLATLDEFDYGFTELKN